MSNWSGLEQIFRLSLGVEIGAHALALFAALEFKQQMQENLQAKTGQNPPVIRISSDEWRAAAGIFDRKAFERAKSKLVDSGIIQIEREGRVLRITLWPEQVEKGSESEANEIERTEGEISQGDEMALEVETTQGTGHETCDGTIREASGELWDRADEGIGARTIRGTEYGTGYGTERGTLHGTNCGTPHGTSCGTPHETSCGTPHETSCGTSIAPSLSCSSETDQPQPPDPPRFQGSNGAMHLLTRMVYNRARCYRLIRYPLKRYSFLRFSFYRYSLNRSSKKIKIFNLRFYQKRINENNVQRNNEQRDNEQRINVYQKIATSDFPIKEKPCIERGTILPVVSKEWIPAAEVGEEFRRLWQSEMGHELTPYELDGLRRFIRLGFTEEIFLKALHSTVLAGKYQMGYLLGILRNWYREGVRHLQDIPQAEQCWGDQRFIQRNAACSG